VVETRIARRYALGVRAPAVLLALALLLVVAACNSSPRAGAEGEDSGTSTAADPVPSSDEDGSDAYAYGWWTVNPQADPGAEPLTKQLDVFREKAQPSDLFPGDRSDDPWGYEDVPEKFRPGSQIYSEARLLLPDAGVEKHDFFGVPSKKGWVCMHLLDPNDPLGAGSGTCINALTDGIVFVMVGTQSRYEVYGLAANEIHRIRIVAGQKSRDAVMGRNAFFLQADPKEICPTEIDFLVLEKEKGQREKVPLDEPGFDETPEPGDESFGCR